MIRLRPSGADEVLIKRVRDWYEPGPGVFIAPQALFSPALLFTTGVNGTWYDPSDLNTLFQDAAGTTPVTAVEQPVGLMLDKSKGLVLGPELVTNGDFATNINGWNVWGSSTNTWDSTNGGRLAVAGNTVNSGAFQTITGLVVGKTYKLSYNAVAGTSNPVFTVSNCNLSGYYQATGSSVIFTVTATSVTVVLGVGANAPGTSYFDNISVRELLGNHAFNPSGNSANFPVLSARYNLYVNTETLATQNVTTVATSYKLTFTGSGSITLTGTATGVYTAGSYTISCTAGTLTSTVLGTVTQADLRVSNDALNQPAYQRVNTATDYDTVGFKPYLKFNGTNQWLQTNSIDFAYGDKMFVCAGVRKLSDTVGMLYELSASESSNPGTTNLYIDTTYTISSSGTARNLRTYGAGIGPITGVVSASLKTVAASSDVAVVAKVNGASVTGVPVLSNASTGNYGNYPLYIGARAGSSFWFNGRLHQLIVAGKQASASEISQTEAFTNQKTGAY